MPSRPPAPARRAGAALAQRGTRGITRRDLWEGVDQGSMMGMEFVAGILVWAGIGWLLDRWLGTGPWLLAIGAIVGNAGGLYLVWLRSQRLEGRERPTSSDDTTRSDAHDRDAHPTHGS